MSLEFETMKISHFVDDMKNGGTPRRSVSKYWENGTIPWLKTGEINNSPILNNSEYITEEGLKKSSAKVLPINSVIMALYGKGTAGRVGLLKFEATTNQACCAMICKDRIKSEYLYYYLLSIQPQIELLANGSVQQNLSKEILADYDINVPKNYQDLKNIVWILKNIDQKIENNKSINKNLEEQLSLLFNDWFVNCTPFKNEELIKSEWGVVPESWKDIEFGELIEITSGNRPDEKSEDKTSEFNIPLFGASKIMGYTKEYSYNEDILIIGRVGTHGVVQRVNYPCFPSDNTFVIKSDYYGFVYQLLKRIDYDSLNTGSTQPLITQKSLKTVNAVLPDEKILSKFEMISKTIFDKIQLNNDEISKLTKLRDTLLPKLMSGEIDVSKINCDLELKYNYMKYLFNQIHTQMSKSVV